MVKSRVSPGGLACDVLLNYPELQHQNGRKLLDQVRSVPLTNKHSNDGLDDLIVDGIQVEGFRYNNGVGICHLHRSRRRRRRGGLGRIAGGNGRQCGLRLLFLCYRARARALRFAII